MVRVPMGVAVLGTTTWAAKQGRDALTIDWDFSKAETRSTASTIRAGRRRRVARKAASMGKFYQRFAQLRDTEVTGLLDKARNFVSSTRARGP